MEPSPKLPKHRKQASPPSEPGFRLGCGISMGLLIAVVVALVLFLAGAIVFVVWYSPVNTRPSVNLESVREREKRHQELLQELEYFPKNLAYDISRWRIENPDAPVPSDLLTWRQLGLKHLSSRLLPTEHFENCLFIDVSFRPPHQDFIGTMKFINKTGSNHALIHFFHSGQSSQLYIE